MSCVFCGNQDVRSYAKCECTRAVQFTRSTLKGKTEYGEKRTTVCGECQLGLNPQDVIGNERVEGRLDWKYQCPRCGHEQTEPRQVLEDKYK